MLLFFLAWSIFLNLLQSRTTDRLSGQIRDMEVLQTILTTSLQELEESENGTDEQQ